MDTDEINERPLPSAIRITDPAYRGSPRHFLGEERFVLKALRRDGAKTFIEEWLNELVTFRLAIRLQVPVPETAVKRMPNGDLHLASALYSELDLLHVPAMVRSKIANIGDLPGLMVLDQLVFNMDRREDHIMLTSDPRTTPNALWYAIDHGHAFRGPDGSGLTVEAVDQLAHQLAPINIDYRISYFSDFEAWLQRLSQLSDVAIDALVLDVVNGIVALGVPVDVRVRLEFRGEVVRALLKCRRDALPTLLRNWCGQSGKPLGPPGPPKSKLDHESSQSDERRV
jgi:hypothetical protein